MIVPFPSIIIIHPIIAADPNLPACLMMRKKEAKADGQKALLWRAIWMKAFFVMNLTYWSRHQSTHLMAQVTTL